MSDEFVAKMKEAIEHLSQIRHVQFDYYLEKLIEQREALLTKFSPLKAGQRAVIVGDIKCDGGWRGCEKTLAVGNVGVVQSVDYSDGQFTCQFVPDKQWWKDHDGEYHEKDRQHSYHLKQIHLAAIPAKAEGASGKAGAMGREHYDTQGLT